MENKFKLNEKVYYVYHTDEGFIIRGGYINCMKLKYEKYYEILYDIRLDRFGYTEESVSEEVIFASIEQAKEWILEHVFAKFCKYTDYDI